MAVIYGFSGFHPSSVANPELMWQYPSGDATFHVVSLQENLFAAYTNQSRCRILPAHGWPGTGFPTQLRELVVDDIATS